MATHSSVLAWGIPGTAESGGLPSTRSHRVGHDWSNLAAAAAGWPWLSFQGVKHLLISCLQSPSAVTKEWRLRGRRRAERSYPTFKVRRGGHGKVPLVQDKRNPSKTVGVARGHQRADRLKPQSQKLANLITWATALSNSMKLSHAVWGHPRWTGHGGEFWQNVVHWRRKWQTTSVLLPWEPHEQYEKSHR